MQLYTAKASPFGRKIWLTTLHYRLADRITQIDSDMTNPDDPMYRLNPLGKMPILVTDDGQCVYDSPVIMEYLDHLLGGALISSDWSERLAQLQMQALADGIMDAATTIVAEVLRRPPDRRHAAAIETQRGKIRTGVAAALQSLPDPTRIQVDSISLACALGYLDRRGQYDWRSVHPELVRWLDGFRTASAAFDLTYLPPDPTWVCP